jgi:hypothetical protein
MPPTMQFMLVPRIRPVIRSAHVLLVRGQNPSALNGSITLVTTMLTGTATTNDLVYNRPHRFKKAMAAIDSSSGTTSKRRNEEDVARDAFVGREAGPEGFGWAWFVCPPRVPRDKAAMRRRCLAPRIPPGPRVFGIRDWSWTDANMGAKPVAT